MPLRLEPAGEVDLRPRDVAVDVDAAGHDDQAARIEDGRVVGKARHDAAVLDANIRHRAVHAVARIVDPPARDAQPPGHAPPPCTRARTAAATSASTAA